MKKVLTVILAAALAFSTLACGNGKDADNTSTPAPQQGMNTPSGDSDKGDSGELLLGMFTELNNAGDFKIKGLKFAAERSGSMESGGINDWEPSLTRIRTVFELDEWVEYTLEYEYGSEEAKLGVWVFPHRPLSEYKAVSEMTGEVFFCEYELPYETYPLPLCDALMLQTRDNASGDYDMLFTLDGKLIGGTLLHFSENGALDGMSDEEIISSMLAVG